jgi:hypothetical protein
MFKVVIMKEPSVQIYPNQVQRYLFISSFSLVCSTDHVSEVWPPVSGTPCIFTYLFRDKWVPDTTAWRVLSLRMEKRPPIRSVAANWLNKQLRTADKGWPSSWEIGRGANNSPPLKLLCCKSQIVNLGPVLIGRRNRSNKKGTWDLPKHRWEDNIKMNLQEVECGGMDWIELARDRDWWPHLWMR